MKRLNIIILIIVISFLYSCQSGSSTQKETQIPFDTFQVKKTALTHFTQVGRLVKAIKLETKEESLLGSISCIRIERSTGDILLGDFGSTKRVLRFNSKGNFLTAYGKVGEGPGEYKRLVGFSLMENGDLILVSDFKLMKFSKEGDLLQETRINISSNGIESINDKTYLSVIRYRNAPDHKSAILVFDSFLIQNQGIGGYDTRYEKYVYTAPDIMTRWGNHLYFLDNYGFAIRKYNVDQRTMQTIQLPSENNDLDGIWQKAQLNGKDQREIRNSLRHFTAIYGYNDGLFLFERWKKKSAYNAWILSFDKKKAVIFPIFALFKNPELENVDKLFFDSVIGPYEGGIVATFDNATDFEKYKSRYPVLKNLSLTPEENPILAFLELNIDRE